MRFSKPLSCSNNVNIFHLFVGDHLKCQSGRPGPSVTRFSSTGPNTPHKQVFVSCQTHACYWRRIKQNLYDIYKQSYIAQPFQMKNTRAVKRKCWSQTENTVNNLWSQAIRVKCGLDKSMPIHSPERHFRKCLIERCNTVPQGKISAAKNPLGEEEYTGHKVQKCCPFSSIFEKLF